MGYEITRDEREIGDVLNQCVLLEATRRNPWPQQTYAQGVEAALLWVCGDREENPILA